MTIKCQHCLGKGKVKLPEKLQDVVDVLEFFSGESTRAEIHKELEKRAKVAKIHPTAISRRLERLLKLKVIRLKGWNGNKWEMRVELVKP